LRTAAERDSLVAVTVAAPAAPVERRSLRWLAAPLVALALVALTVGIVAREVGRPRGAYFDLFFSDTIHMKALGFQTGTTRSYVHSLIGSAFFGAYAAKVTIVELKRFPVLVLPIAGGFLFTLLLVVWWTSSLWFFRTIDTGF
jgi:hypothetical protein